eukprot:scaffold840_cov344-Pavlova_lutheri.AAC.113
MNCVPLVPADPVMSMNVLEDRVWGWTATQRFRPRSTRVVTPRRGLGAFSTLDEKKIRSILSNHTTWVHEVILHRFPGWFLAWLSFRKETVLRTGSFEDSSKQCHKAYNCKVFKYDARVFLSSAGKKQSPFNTSTQHLCLLLAQSFISRPQDLELAVYPSSRQARKRDPSEAACWARTSPCQATHQVPSNMQSCIFESIDVRKLRIAVRGYRAMDEATGG